VGQAVEQFAVVAFEEQAVVQASGLVALCVEIAMVVRPSKLKIQIENYHLFFPCCSCDTVIRESEARE
jgi:hypothetical protein